MNKREPAAADWDGHGKVLIWDISNGCMLGDIRRRKELARAPVTHWQPIPRAWRAMSNLPTCADADVWGCVLVQTLVDGPKIIGWNNPMIKTGDIIGWQKLPEGPEGEMLCSRENG